MFGEGSETCVPVSGKAKRPAVRPSVDWPTYGHESGERQGRALPGFPLGQIWKSGRALVGAALGIGMRHDGSPGAQLGNPLYPQEQTSSAEPIRSEKCQLLTHAPQQKGTLFDHLVDTSLRGSFRQPRFTQTFILQLRV
jgi:hypothetical protein